ncbi:MAG TPA: FKBP-type peptidyl-prolyl cis-trans isomerase [Syntrophorhabdaceae bacterium]|nr:FKBP-type peptidyl-prolyl cis-trans isomerase [Syntrophorhabdaceae bacterium]
MRFSTSFFRNIRVVAIIIVCCFIVESTASSQEAAVPKNQKEKSSYALGANIGRSMKALSIEFDPNMFMQGAKDAYSGTMKLTDQEIMTVLNNLNKEMQTKQTEMMKLVGERNKQEGAAFLKENAEKPGILKLPSGLQYKVLKEGDGKIPKSTDTVVVHYRGTLINGTEFDSSYKRNQPAEFKVNGVIPGWTEILQKMKTGSKYMVYVPSALGYGEKGGGPIAPNSVLIFEIELLSVK